MALLQQWWKFRVPISEKFSVGIITPFTDSETVSETMAHGILQSFSDFPSVVSDPPSLNILQEEITPYDQPFGFVRGALKTLWISDERYFPTPSIPKKIELDRS
jgi:hypothetical protein